MVSRSPVSSASLSELEPLLSEEDPVFLEEAADSTGFSTGKQQFVNAFPRFSIETAQYTTVYYISRLTRESYTPLLKLIAICCFFRRG